MSKQEVRYKGYTVVNNPMAGWYQWVIYGPEDKGIVGGAKEYEAYFDVEFFDNGNIVRFSCETIESGISKWVNA